MRQAHSTAIAAFALFFLLGAADGGLETSPVEMAASCDSGSVEACVSLGKKYYEGSGVKRNRTLANKFFSRACDRQDAPACAFLALSYLNGDGVTKNYNIAYVAADRACQLGDEQGSVALACNVKAGILAKGLGRSPNYEKAFSYLNQSCEMGQQEACLTLSRSMRLGYLPESDGTYSVIKNVTRARELAGSACQQKIAAGCYEMAQLPSHDKRDFALFMARSCDYGMGNSCFELTKALDSGRAASNAFEDVKPLEHYRSEACRLNIRAACNWKSRATLEREASARQATMVREANARAAEDRLRARQARERDRETAAKMARWNRGDCRRGEFYCYVYGERNGIRTGTATASHIKPSISLPANKAFSCTVYCNNFPGSEKVKITIQGSDSNDAHRRARDMEDKICRSAGWSQGASLGSPTCRN